MRERVLTGICLALSLSTAAAAEDDARAWLERMNRALATRNYDGTFFHLRNGKVETLRIIHRVENGKVAERLVSLDSGREIVRNDKELTCYLPDQRRVLVEPRQDEGPLLGTLPDFDAAVTENYKLQKLASGRPLLGRSTQVIAVNPNDAYRFGYRLWIDQETALPLKTQLCDERGNVVEQVLFANITLPASIPLSAVRPQVDASGLQWVKQPAPTQASASIVQLWRAGKVPPGFRLTATNTQLMDGSKTPVAHLVYSDGLASVSVFIETKSADREQMNGLARVGSAFAFSTTVRGHQVTAVGEVPAQTVQLIAHSTKPDVDAAAAERRR
jgi:sigma-E factor negative regulatory protein RseB